jgi:hypothetical protein
LKNKMNGRRYHFFRDEPDSVTTAAAPLAAKTQILQPGGHLERLCLVDGFPGEFRFVAAEVAV